MSRLRKKQFIINDEEIRRYSGADEALMAHGHTIIKTREPIYVRINNEIIKTSVGRIIFNTKLPEELQYINEGVRAADLKTMGAKGRGYVQAKE